MKAGLLADNKGKLRQARQHARELSLAINGTKRQIDALKAAEEAVTAEQVACLSPPPHGPMSDRLGKPSHCTSAAMLLFHPCRGVVRLCKCMARIAAMGHDAMQEQIGCTLFLCLAGIAAMVRSSMQMQRLPDYSDAWLGFLQRDLILCRSEHPPLRGVSDYGHSPKLSALSMCLSPVLCIPAFTCAVILSLLQLTVQHLLHILPMLSLTAIADAHMQVTKRVCLRQLTVRHPQAALHNKARS